MLDSNPGTGTAGSLNISDSVPVTGKGASSSTGTRCGPDSVGGLVK